MGNSLYSFRKDFNEKTCTLQEMLDEVERITIKDNGFFSCTERRLDCGVTAVDVHIIINIVDCPRDHVYHKKYKKTHFFETESGYQVGELDLDRAKAVVQERRRDRQRAAERKRQREEQEAQIKAARERREQEELAATKRSSEERRECEEQAARERSANELRMREDQADMEEAADEQRQREKQEVRNIVSQMHSLWTQVLNAESAEDEDDDNLAEINLKKMYTCILNFRATSPENKELQKWNNIYRLKETGNEEFNVGVQSQELGNQRKEQGLAAMNCGKLQNAKEHFENALVHFNKALAMFTEGERHDAGFQDCIEFVNESIACTEKSVQDIDIQIMAQMAIGLDLNVYEEQNEEISGERMLDFHFNLDGN